MKLNFYKRNEIKIVVELIPILIGKALDAGTVKLVGTDKSAIIHNVSVLIRDPKAYEVMSRANNPYGDGLACSRIINTLSANKE